MWIFTKDAVISAVEFDPTNGYDSEGLIPPQERTHLMVRARRREHLVNFGFSESKVVESITADYPYRVFISKTTFGEMMQRHAESIDYENYKGEAADNLPYEMLTQIWASAKVHLDPRETPPSPDDVPF